MQFLFWILLVLSALFSSLTIAARRRKGKLQFRYLVPALLFLLPTLLLSGIYVYYNTQLRPRLTVSTVLLENETFWIGHASRPQPGTLDEYISIVAEQIGEFNAQSDTFWPDSSFDDAVVYFITNDKRQAWKVNHDGSYVRIDNVNSVPRFDSVMGYHMEFFPLRPEQDGETGMLVVISLEDLLNQEKYERYTHIGMYDPILTYIHEGFHIFAQDGANWTDADISKAYREEALENLDARKLRTYAIGLLYRALQDDANRDTHVQQALRLYQAYKANFPEEYERVQYFERIEGSASYFEVVSSLQVSYPEINSTNYADAVALWTTNRQPQDAVGASHEAYELGALAGVLLDLYADDPNQWKVQLQNTPTATPMELLEEMFTAEQLEQVTVPEIDEEFTDALVASIARGRDVNANLISLLYNIFF